MVMPCGSVVSYNRAHRPHPPGLHCRIGNTWFQQSVCGLVIWYTESLIFYGADDSLLKQGKCKFMGGTIGLGLQYTFHELIEKDKEDERMRRLREQLLWSEDIRNVRGLETEVKIISISILSTDRSDIVLPIAVNGNPKAYGLL